MDTSFRPFVYGLYDPADAGHIRYVGMAHVRASRPYDHAKWARKPSTKPSHFKHWILKLQTEGRDYGVMVLEELADSTSANFLGFVEKCYIKSLRQIGHDLTNVAEGGNGGNLGSVVVAKMAEAKRGKPTTTGYKYTPEQCARISAGLKGHGHPQTPETREKIRNAKWRHMLSPETLAKRSAGSKAAWAKRKLKIQ